ncbi:MAG: T9SS type A sorting domain-containing protein, partial [Flavitalea sp.]
KPKENICGRFYADQLERDILIPRKRIPWVRYFFQFTWPAFVLLLKSCGQLTATKGKVVVKTEQPVESYPIVLGGIMGQIEAVQPNEIKTLQEVSVDVQGEITTGILALDEENEVELDDTIPSVKMEKTVPPEKDTIVISKNEMDTVVVSLRGIVLGGIGVRGIQILSNEPANEIELKSAPVPRIFPNPAIAGSLVTIAYKEDETIPDIVQIFTVAGQLVQQERISISKDASVFNLNLPSTLKPGMYLLRFIDTKNNKQHTEKLVIQ